MNKACPKQVNGHRDYGRLAHSRRALSGLALVVTFLGHTSAATTRYVATNSPSPAAPYAAWGNAAHTLQEAVDVSVAGDQILATNGVYGSGGRAVIGAMTNRLVIDKAITVSSVNGPDVTIITGAGVGVGSTNNGDGAIRCAYVSSGATLAGFTLTNGHTRLLGYQIDEQSGGGACCEVGATISNCTIAGNAAYFSGGGVSGGSVASCRVVGNRCDQFGGGFLCLGGAEAINSLFVGNVATQGAGVYCLGGGQVVNCTVSGNRVPTYGGAGVRCETGGCVVSTILYNNTGVLGLSDNYYGGSYSNCCLWPLPIVESHTDCVTSQPLFVDAAGGNFRLTANSPCRDAGLYQEWMAGATDLDGRNRVVGGGVDIGAYELVWGITASAGPNAVMSPGGTVWVATGSNSTFFLGAYLGYKVTNVVVDGVSIGATGQWTFVDVVTNHTISVSAGPEMADVGLTVRVDDTNPAPETLVTYTLTLTNSGPDRATDIRVGEVLPDGVNYVWVSFGDGYQPLIGLWNIDYLDVGEVAQLGVLCLVDPGTSRLSFTNYADILFATQADSNPTNNSATAVLVVADAFVDERTNRWTWIGGSSAVDQAGLYGTLGVPAATNGPGARCSSVTWLDEGGQFLLFGGFGTPATGVAGYLNDLWRFDGSNWTWLAGSDGPNRPGVYGTMWQGDSSTVPGARNESVSWADNYGGLWLFGGRGCDASGTNGYLNDLWCFTGNHWTWMSGSNRVDQAGVYGTYGASDGSNVPGGRAGGVSWFDGFGRMWLFGGQGCDGEGHTGYLNDLWRFDGYQWTWMSGSTQVAQSGAYGELYVPSHSNAPGARAGGVSWVGADGQFWLFGGYGRDEAGAYGYLNDLWCFDGTDWAWMGGSNLADAGGVYGVRGLPGWDNTPGARAGSVTWTDSHGRLWLFGGEGYDANGVEGYLADLWCFDGDDWVWVSGGTVADQAGVYGTPGIPGVANQPPPRQEGAAWVDANDTLWMLGGTVSNGLRNDLWQFSSAWVTSITLVVTSTYGGAEPAGTSVLDAGSLVHAAVTNSPVASGSATQFLCLGWTGTGSATSGTGTYTTFVITNDTTLVWNWKTQVVLTVTAGAHGTVGATNGWYDWGSTGVVVTAVADGGWWFGGWTGTVTSSANPLVLTMDRAQTVVARFESADSPSNTHYVVASNITPAFPYTKWETAATRIQDAVDAATDGDTVLVSNGVYAAGGRAVYGSMTNRVAIDRTIRVRSVNGPGVTVIQGQGPVGDGAIRCAYVGSNAVLSGFTLTNGATLLSGDAANELSGGGAWCETNAVVTNCFLVGNEATSYGGGAYNGRLDNCTLSGNSAYSGGGASYGTLCDCTLSGNSASSDGGGATDGTLDNCTLSDNSATSGGGAVDGTLCNCTLSGNSASFFGGGTANGTLSNCTLSGNSAFFGGGAAYGTTYNCTLSGNSAHSGGGSYYGTLNSCALSGNSAASSEGGGAAYGTLYNCTLSGNSARYGGGAADGTVYNCMLSSNSASFYGGGAYGGTLDNCKLSGNSASLYGGGAGYGTLYNCTLSGNSAGGGGGAAYGTLYNCTLSGNSASSDGGGAAYSALTNCIVYGNAASTSGSNVFGGSTAFTCTTPDPGGVGNITNDPQFVDAVSSNFHLKVTSPCINAGAYEGWMVGAMDGDGNPRIAHGVVDMGAYEYALALLPVVDNGNGASAVGVTSARLNGNLISDGGTNTTVRFYWGLVNGGAVATNWGTNVALAAASVGPVVADATGLTPGAIYWYRCSASNAAGAVWAPASSNLRTLALFRLVVAGAPAPHGSPSPYGYGTNSAIVEGSTMTNVVNSPVAAGTTQYVCSGGAVAGNAFTPVNATKVTLTLTNDATLTWTWRTQYALNAAAGPCGSVVASNGWYDAGTTGVVVTAGAAGGCHFIGWTGTVTSSANPLILTMDRAQSLMAVFVTSCVWSVTSAHGTPVPAAGTYTNDASDTVTCRVSRVEAAGSSTQYVCTGWTGTGSATNGTGTNTNFTITNGTTIVWNWETQVLLTVTAGVYGTVTPSTGWYDLGTTGVVVTAVPSPGCSFAGWSGDIATNVNPLVLTLNRAWTLGASFVGGIVRVAPSRGPSAGGNRVVVDGYSLGSGVDIVSVRLCGVPAQILSQSSTQVLVRAGAAVTCGPGDVVLQSISQGTKTLAVGYTYMPMALVPGGTFSMGIYQGNGGHSVTVSNFYIDVGPVTVGEYLDFCAATARPGPPAPAWGWSGTNLPIVNVTWNQAAAYAAWAGKRLPTEAEYEYAMRGGVADCVYPWGDTIATNNANYFNSVGHPTVAGSYATNAYGLFDVAGNVWEWCGDWYQTVLSGPATNPAGPVVGTNKVARGGSWGTAAKWLRCSSRYSQMPSSRYVDMGFRCALTAADGPIPASEADANNNGIPDWWEMWYFGTVIGQGGVLDGTLDPDGDGQNNRQEAEANTDPLDPLSVFRITDVVSPSGGVGFAVGWLSQTGRTYTVERADNLMSAFTPVTGNLPATPPRNAYTNQSLGSGPWLYRVRVNR